MDDMREVLGRRSKVDRLPTPHRCAIALGSADDHARKLAKFYEGMVMLHSPEVVIVFGDAGVAKQWLKLGW